MKSYIIVIFILFCSSQAFSQWFLPSDVETSLDRIEQAIRSGDPRSIEDLIPSGITMRLGDSLYESVSSITAIKALDNFFTDKDSVQFYFGLPGNGQMVYYVNGKKKTDEVDVWLRRRDGFIEISALNISNYPIATVFFRMNRKEAEKPSRFPK
jgi:hypothetical protein